MNLVRVHNVNYALREGVLYLNGLGDESTSRNGKVLVAPGPVLTCYAQPQERVLFSALRDANPFFHLMESLWMLAGRNDSAFPAHYAAQMAQYSDDGTTLNGAYGFRWREYFGYDQLSWAIEELKVNPNSRRVVISMWDPGQSETTGDFYKATNGSLDVPCNTVIYLRAHNRKLDLTVCCRSNDMVWGAYGANAVHFSVLQEFLAVSLGIEVGVLYQLSNNFHAYIERPDTARLMRATDVELTDNRYAAFRARCSPLVFGEPAQFLAAVSKFVEEPFGSPNSTSSFIEAIARPMAEAHAAHKAGDTKGAIERLEGSPQDWHIAGREWLERRLAKQEVKS